MKIIKLKLLLICGTAFVSACSFVSLDPGAKDVAIQTDSKELKMCKYIGDTNVSLWSKADTFQSQKTVEDQLDTLARNRASSMGGNAIKAISGVDSHNQRTYSIYKCPIN